MSRFAAEFPDSWDRRWPYAEDVIRARHPLPPIAVLGPCEPQEADDLPEPCIYCGFDPCACPEAPDRADAGLFG